MKPPIHPSNGDTLCMYCDEWVNKTCWKCGRTREDIEELYTYLDETSSRYAT